MVASSCAVPAAKIESGTSTPRYPATRVPPGAIERDKAPGHRPRTGNRVDGVRGDAARRSVALARLCAIGRRRDRRVGCPHFPVNRKRRDPQPALRKRACIRSPGRIARIASAAARCTRPRRAARTCRHERRTPARPRRARAHRRESNSTPSIPEGHCARSARAGCDRRRRVAGTTAWRQPAWHREPTRAAATTWGSRALLAHGWSRDAWLRPPHPVLSHSLV